MANPPTLRLPRAITALPRRPRRVQLLYALAGTILYAALLVPAERVVGDEYAALVVLPVALIAWLWGWRVGLLAGLLGGPLNQFVYEVTQFSQLSSLLPAEIASVAVGMAVGGLSELAVRLHSSQQRLDTILANAPVLLFAVDQNGTITMERGKALARIGLVPGGNVGRNFFELYRDRPEVVGLLRRALAGEDASQAFAERGVAVDVHYSPVRDGRRVVGAIGVGFDVSERHRAELAARGSEERFRRLFELSPVASIVTRRDGGAIVDANPAFLQLTGFARDEVLGKTTVDLGFWSEEQRRAFSGGGAVDRGRNVEVTLRTRGGDARTLLVSWDAVELDGERYVVATGTDLTEHLRAEEALRRSEERFARLFRENPAGLLVSRLSDGVVLDANDAWLGMTGFAREETIGKTVVELGLWVEPGARRALADRLQREGQIRDYEFKSRVRSGEVREALASFEMVDFGGERCVLTSAIDITDRKRAERALEHRALHDDLTGLPNRVLLLDRLEQSILTARRHHGTFALLVMDLDHFKEVNDTFGHHAGDQLLAQVGPRLRELLRESDTVARLGGDEFALILSGAGDTAAQRVARGVLDALAEPFVVEGQALRIEASMGIVVYPQHGDDADTLLRRADIAMYVAKRSGSSAVEYDPAADEHTPARLALLGELGAAIERGELVLHFHPEVSLRTGKVVAMEALVRWKHPERGLIPPDEFIPIAERSGLMKPLTLWVLRHALAECATWQAAGLALGVAVNLSPRSLVDPELPQIVGALLDASRVSPLWLSLEITESVLMTDPKRATETLARLRRMGARLSIDDFGTGYSSLGYLHELAVHQVKIDKSFVKGVRIDRGSAAIVRATVELGHNLGFEVVAEGVEDEATTELLGRVGCDLIQGYYVAMPMPSDEVLGWIERYGKDPRIAARVTV
ncbi:MAG TPA: EAL domain-containing protein [Candidatus Dormibacteraeota bacterium]|nr:EAL domain-containing protein [Candidatus Dormibacteraeota bacterium]